MDGTTVADYVGLFIGGQWVATTSNDRIASVSPGGAGRRSVFQLASVLDVDDVVDGARIACDEGSWASTSDDERMGAAERLWVAFGGRSIPSQSDSGARSRRNLHGRRDLADIRPGRGCVVVIAAPDDVSLSALGVEIVTAIADGSVVIVALPPEVAAMSRQIAGLLATAATPVGVASVLICRGPVLEYLATHPDIDRVIITSRGTGTTVAVA